jgi:hypothetical protein
MMLHILWNIVWTIKLNRYIYIYIYYFCLNDQIHNDNTTRLTKYKLFSNIHNFRSDIKELPLCTCIIKCYYLVRRIYLLLNIYVWLSPNFKDHKFMCGPQDSKIFSLSPHRSRCWPFLPYPMGVILQYFVWPLTDAMTMFSTERRNRQEGNIWQSSVSLKRKELPQFCRLVHPFS